MARLYGQNGGVLCLGVSIGAMGAFFGDDGGILRHGTAIAVAVFFTIKGSSKLRCKLSDVLLAAVAFSLIVLSKIVPSSRLVTIVLEAGGFTGVAGFFFSPRSSQTHQSEPQNPPGA